VIGVDHRHAELALAVYVNVIPGTIITILVAALVKIDKADPSLLKGADYIGMVLMAVSLGTAEYVLKKARAGTGSTMQRSEMAPSLPVLRWFCSSFAA